MQNIRFQKISSFFRVSRGCTSTSAVPSGLRQPSHDCCGCSITVNLSAKKPVNIYPDPPELCIDTRPTTSQSQNNDCRPSKRRKSRPRLLRRPPISTKRSPQRQKNSRQNSLLHRRPNRKVRRSASSPRS